MYKLRTAEEPNPDLTRLIRPKSESNLTWCARAFKEMGDPAIRDWTLILLIGGRDQLSHRVRVAQSHMRNDLLPSYWSDCLLLEYHGTDVKKAKAHHVPLMQPSGGVFPTVCNGVVETTLQSVADSEAWPNIALIALPVAQRLVLAKLEQFMENRAPIDALQHLVRWLSFAWGVSGTPNPIHEGIGLPSACMLEVACAAAQLELTPGVESRGSCPEVIWSAARYWHKYYASSRGAQPKGRFNIGHKYDIAEAKPKKKAAQ